MAIAPPKTCNYPGCGVVSKGSRCDKHKPVDNGVRQRFKRYDKDRGSAHSRGYGATWRRLRKLILSRQPICNVCGIKPSEQVDHIVPKKQGGTDEMDNLQGLCFNCHQRKTARGL